MKYYIDTEFIECAKQRKVLGIKVGPPVPTIDLISIALVAEDGREFFALNADCELEYAWADEWVRKNVLAPIYQKYYSGDMRLHYDFTLSIMRRLFKKEGVKRDALQEAIVTFVGGSFHYQAGCHRCGYWEIGDDKPSFYGYYSDYDWVVFCQLFGRMINLPRGFPMFCLDLKQEMERLIAPETIKPSNANEHDALADARWNKALHERLAAQYPSAE